MLIDYNNSLVNLTSSILMYFDAEYNHNTLKEVDEILKEKYKKKDSWKNQTCRL